MAPVLARRREVWLPTLWGWLALFLGWGIVSVVLVKSVYPFLAVSRPVGASVLVVEGWMGRKELDQAVAVFRAGGYGQVVTTGGPLHGWPEASGESTYAHKAADYLRRHGLEGVPVTAAPSPLTHQDRTYNSAIMVREWAQKSGAVIGKLDIVSRGPHARRSRFLYEQAFGQGIEVGIVAVHPQDYDENRWWRTSTGAREVSEQAAGLLWVKLFFDPRRQAPVRAREATGADL